MSAKAVPGHLEVEWDRASLVQPHQADLARAPLVDGMGVVELIAATTTKVGLKVESALDTVDYERDIKVSNAQMKTLDIQGDAFHPEWNYTIRPRLTRLEKTAKRGSHKRGRVYTTTKDK
jgi:DDE family transposase